MSQTPRLYSELLLFLLFKEKSERTLLFLIFSVLVANPKKTTLHGGQSRSRSAEQEKKEGKKKRKKKKKKKVWQRPPSPPPPRALFGLKKKGNRQKWVYPPLFQTKVRGGKMQTSSPPVITPNRSQSNPDDMITLPRPIQSVGMDLHDVSGTSTGQTLPRERRALPGTHFCPTIWWVYPHSATIFILHPLLSTFSSTFVRNIKQQLQGSCARVRRIQNARRRNHLRMVRGGAQTHTRSAAAAARILRPGPQDPKRQAS